MQYTFGKQISRKNTHYFFHGTIKQGLTITLLAIGFFLGSTSSAFAQSDREFFQYQDYEEPNRKTNDRRPTITTFKRLRKTQRPAHSPQYTNRLSVSPLAALFGIGSFTWEHRLKEHFSLALSPTFFHRSSSGDDSFTMGMLGIGLNYYPSSDDLRGFKLSASITPGFAAGGDVLGFGIGGRATGGYQWIWQSGFSLGLNLGTQLIAGTVDGDAGLVILPVVDLNLGFAF